MQNQPVAKKPVLFQLQTGLYLGLVCYNPLFETLQFVLEKKDFFEVEWPALIIHQEKGLFPVLLGLPHITIQRAQIIWYSTHVPQEILRAYQAFLPVTGSEAIPSKEEEKKQEEKKQEVKKASPKKQEEKIIPFPLKREEK